MKRRGCPGASSTQPQGAGRPLVPLRAATFNSVESSYYLEPLDLAGLAALNLSFAIVPTEGLFL
jgi:hypothetical protein